MDVRDDALQEEISLTTERYHTKKYGDLPALVFFCRHGMAEAIV